MDLETSNVGLRTTRWSLIQELRDGPERQAALSRLIEMYWPAVYSFLRRSGKAREAAAELTQAFFAEVVLERGLFTRADPNCGRLRSLLLRALRNFAIDAHRAGRRNGVTLDEGRLAAEEERLDSCGEADPDAAFDRRWALAHMDEALRRTEEHFLSSGRRGHWELFETRVLRACRGATPPALGEIAPGLGFASAAEAAAAVQTVKRYLLAQLRVVASESVRNPEEAEVEWKELRLKLA